MAQEMCRLCLSKDGLKSIFPDKEEAEKVTAVLELFTGLKIGINDGLPQQICTECTDTINNFLTFRNRTHTTEMELIKLGFRRTVQIKEANADINDSFEGFVDFNKQFKIEVELDRITQVDDAISDRSDPEISVSILNKKTNRKEDYLNLVEGEFVPDVYPVICRVCKKSYSQWNSFVSHAKVHLKKALTMENPSLQDIKIEIDDKADTGTKVAKKKSRKQVRQQYLSLVEGDLDPNGPVKCKVCKKTLNRWNSFMNHARKHLGFKIVCEFCGKSFASSNQLKRHCRSFHGMQRDMKCKHCNYFALDVAQLKVHERREHTGERPFVCDLCAAAYFSRKCLLQHIESHRTTASVQCDKCPLTFKSRRHLAKHMYGTHSDKRRERRRERRAASKVASL
ncbi:hypothetical protein O0L34_g16823 [Tuta absoluta]|nr:hypothetical protein O0L34_g16823 [Tuta absoluta]